MARSISVFRRRPLVVDLNLADRPGIKEYRFKAAANFDAAMTLFATVPARLGLRSPTVVESGPDDGQYRGKTRFLFNPADYTGSVPAVDDSKPFWVSIASVTDAGVVNPDEAPHLILPFSSTPNRAFNIAGAVGTSVVELQLPSLVNNFTFQVDDANNLFVAFEPGGTEHLVPSLSALFTNFQGFQPSFSQLFLRGSAAATDFHASFRLVNGPMMLSVIHLLSSHPIGVINVR